MTRGHCAAVGCRARILPHELFCQRHVVMIETDTRRVLERTHKPFKKPSKVFLETLSMAMQEILDQQTTGHARPKPQTFEFEDENTEALHGR